MPSSAPSQQIAIWDDTNPEAAGNRSESSAELLHLLCTLSKPFGRTLYMLAITRIILVLPEMQRGQRQGEAYFPGYKTSAEACKSSLQMRILTR
jgi:hypothetical protein